MEGTKITVDWNKKYMDLFFDVNLLNKEVYDKIKSIRGSEWTEEFDSLVYDNVKKYNYFITNLGKCTQIDARPLPDSVYRRYLHLLEKEIEIVNPKVIVLLGNQVSSIVLEKKISVSLERKNTYEKDINGNIYKCYPVFYPVGNGRFNIDKSIEDIKWIIDSIKDGNVYEKNIICNK